MVHIYGPDVFTLHKKNTNETTLKHVDETLELMKEHCFVPLQAVRHQCHDEVLHSHCCSAPVVFHLQLAPNIWGCLDSRL